MVVLAGPALIVLAGLARLAQARLRVQRATLVRDVLDQALRRLVLVVVLDAQHHRIYGLPVLCLE